MKAFVNEELVLELELAFPPERVFRGLTLEIASWWSHRFRDGSAVGFEPRIGGRFYEDFGGGSAALYAFVTYIEPPIKLRLEGSMGMDGPVVSVMDFDFAKSALGTRLSLRHFILGSLDPGTVEEYRSGWGEILGKTLPAWLAGGSSASV